MKLKECCNTDSLTLVRRVYESNADVFDVKKCPHCQTFWLYRYLEENWWENLQMKFEEFEEWYCRLSSNDLDAVEAMNLSDLSHGQEIVYVKTQSSLSAEEWQRMCTPRAVAFSSN